MISCFDRLPSTLAGIAHDRFVMLQAVYPLTGKRRAARLGGIVSALKSGRWRNSRWGRSMLGKRGGLALKRQRPWHFQQMAQRRKQQAREGKYY